MVGTNAALVLDVLIVIYKSRKPVFTLADILLIFVGATVFRVVLRISFYRIPRLRRHFIIYDIIDFAK